MSAKIACRLRSSTRFQAAAPPACYSPGVGVGSSGGTSVDMNGRTTGAEHLQLFPHNSGGSSTSSLFELEPGCPSVPVESRQGRHKQRYGQNGERLVAGTIPVKFIDDGSGTQQVKVCMITTRGGNGLVFPKGGWEDDETLDCAARRETVEEAGVRGMLEEPMLGEFSFLSTKPKTCQNSTSGQPQKTGKCLAYMFVMRVQEELLSWPESNDRQRIWCELAEASRQCKHQWMREALQILTQRMALSGPNTGKPDDSLALQLA